MSHSPVTQLIYTDRESNVSIGLILATKIAMLPNVTFIMEITNPPEAKQIITCSAERPQPRHRFSGPSAPSVVSTVQMLHRCLREFVLWLYPVPV